MRAMSTEEWRRFLTDRARTGMLATTRADGRPHVAPIWFDLDGDEIVFTTWHSSVKAANLRRDGRAALCVDDETPPYAYVLIEGDVTIAETTPDLRQWATRLATRYLGDDQGQVLGARNGVEGEWLVRLRPTNVVAITGIAD